MSARVKSILFLLFVASGFCGLLYQVVWIRLAFASFGVITPVLSVILSVFMLGLFVGSWAAGRWVNRLTSRYGISAIHFYAVSELLIAIGAWAVPTLFAMGETTLLTAGAADSSAYLWWSSVIIAAAIFPWCIFMGATFPLMTGFIKEQDEAEETSFSFLYLANVIGAMLGTLLTALVLVELLGFRQTLLVAAVCNILIGLVAMTLGTLYPLKARSATARRSDMASKTAVVADLPRGAAWGLLSILFLTGFTSMAMEVAWTRAFTVVLRTQVYSFALLLFVYLLATWVGSAVYRWHLRQGNPWSTARLVALLAVAALLPLVMNDPRLRLRWMGALASIFPFCALLGYMTPKLIDEYSRGRPDRVGLSYAANILGCILGPLVASYWMLPEFGLKYVLLLLAAPFILLLTAYGLASQLTIGQQRLYGGAAFTLLVLGLVFARTYEDHYADLNDKPIVRRDHTATTLSCGQGMEKRLLVNGMGITHLTTITKIMAHLPLAHLEERPQSGLVICFGMGTTWRSLMSWDIDATAVELVPSVKDAFSYYFDDADQLLAKPNGRIVIDDGRRFLRRTTETFDVITLDPPPPVEAAGSSLLYSEEFYDAVKSRLTPQGILQQWIPSASKDVVQAVARSLLRSFPYVKMYTSYDEYGTHFLASRRPLGHPSAEQLVARMPAAARADLLEWSADKDPVAFMRLILSKECDPHAFAGEGTERVTDDQPFNEYFLLRQTLKPQARQWPDKRRI